mmetsp:Transcript_4296/g.9678  ORF Transcript_4296/g.9678 Transcript_4296/m.9678 type:complete len:228 (-) Transcript_4296:679-1362(-)
MLARDDDLRTSPFDSSSAGTIDNAAQSEGASLPPRLSSRLDTCLLEDCRALRSTALAAAIISSSVSASAPSSMGIGSAGGDDGMDVSSLGGGGDMGRLYGPLSKVAVSATVGFRLPSGPCGAFKLSEAVQSSLFPLAAYFPSPTPQVAAAPSFVLPSLSSGPSSADGNVTRASPSARAASDPHATSTVSSQTLRLTSTEEEPPPPPHLPVGGLFRNHAVNLLLLFLL